MTDPKQERYRREKKMGVGSLGEVWLATDLQVDRQVVIKYLQTAYDLTHKEQFLRETRVLSDLNHPNIIPVCDAVFEDGDPGNYLVMEYFEGSTIPDIIAESGPLPLATVLQVTMAILRALSQAHRHGIVHRDIKPTHIMLKRNADGEEVKLLDFGLAILKQDTELRAGSLAYLAPEQFQGHPLDGRADLYSLGVTLFEMIAGVPFPLDHADTEKPLNAQLRRPVLPLSEFSPSIPPVLEHIVMRMLAKDPENRYPSADVLMNILDSIHASLRHDKPHLKLLEHDAAPLSGRTRELEQLETAWNQVQMSGQPRLLVIHGDMGIGKTRLVAEFLDKQVADRGFVPLVGRCDEYGVPYAPFVEILATIFRSEPLQSATLAEEKARILLYIPELARHLNTYPSGALKVPQHTQWRFFRTILTVLGQLGPTVLFLEDATHLDEASVALTRYLIRHGADLRLLIIAACRDTGDSIPWLGAFRIDETEVLTLRPLSADAIRAHLPALLNGPVSDSVLRTVHTRSSGIPLYIDVISDLLIEEGEFYQAETGEWQYKPSMKTRPMSPTLMNLFAQRLGRLSQKSFKALALAAVIDTEFNFDGWLAVLGGDSECDLALDVLDEALGMQIVRAVGEDRYRFQPPDIARVLAASLTADRRRHLHRQIARKLSDQDAEPAPIAHHYEQAGLTEDAARYLEKAGARATTANAVNQAIAYYDRAVALEPSPTSYEALGHLYFQKAAKPESIEAFTQAFEMARQEKDILAQARILNNLSLAHCRFGDFQDAHKSATAVLELEGVSETQQAVARSNLGAVCWHIGQLAEAEELCRSAVNVLGIHADGPNLAKSYSRLGLALFARGKYPEAKAAHESALEIYRSTHDYCGQAHCLNRLALVAVDQGEFKRAASLLDEAHRLFAEMDSQEGLTAVSTIQGRLLLRRGKAREALPTLIEALELARQTGASISSSLYDTYLLIAEVNVELGDLKWAMDALAPVENAENPQLVARAQAIRARIYELQGDGAGAQGMYSAALTTFEQLGNPSGLLRTKQHYARYLAAQGSAESARALRDATLAEAARIGLHL